MLITHESHHLKELGKEERIPKKEIIVYIAYIAHVASVFSYHLKPPPGLPSSDPMLQPQLL
jgi:hypothetical protein